MRGFDRSPHCRNDDNTGYGASQNRCIGDRSKVLDEHGAAAADLVRRTAAPFLFPGTKGYWTKLAFRREMRLVRRRPITAATPAPNSIRPVPGSGTALAAVTVPSNRTPS